MITLSIEQSTVQGSVALLRDEAILETRAWEYTWRSPQHLFAVVPEVLGAASVEIGEIDRFAAGLGPGSFAGCRMAVSTARALALPGDMCVFGVSSGEALAFDVLRETQAESVFVVGDARRQHVWFAQFKRGDLGPLTIIPWSLRPSECLADVLTGNAVIVSSEWDRLSSLLKQACPNGALLIEENRFPAAAALGLLACRKVTDHISSDPISPIYLHPAVRPDYKSKETR